MKIRNTLLLIMIFLAGNAAWAQLPGFTFSVTSEPQTCLGNGSLEFSVSGTQTGASIEYEVFLLPNTTTAVTTVTTPFAGSLVAGDYLIIATQVLNGESSSETANATIQDEFVPLAYWAEAIECLDNGSITVNVTAGSPVSYELMSGPVTAAPQSSNEFHDLPPGEYAIRVYDECGDALVITVQLVPNPVMLWVDSPLFEADALTSCDEITVGTYFGNNYHMQWPVTFEYTVYPPGGGDPITVIKTESSYTDEQISYVGLPFFDGPYEYDLSMTDACGNTIYDMNNTVNLPFNFSVGMGSGSCDNYYLFIGEFENYIAPFTVTFLSAPAGFNPWAANPSHPDFSSTEITYGSPENGLPVGNYIVQVTDDCGRTIAHSITITGFGIPTVEVGTDESGCTANITISLPFERDMESATVIAAPAGYGDVPVDVSSSINGGELFLSGLPAGDYSINVVDECGIAYNIAAEVILPPIEPELNSSALPGCTPGEGSVSMWLYNANLETVTIIDAPDGFWGTLPMDVSYNILPELGNFTMASLPEGSYTFTSTDVCGNERQKTVYVEGYEVYESVVTVIENCGSFDLQVEHSSNGTNSQNFWLQKFNEETGFWGHPETGESDPIGYFYFGNAIELNNFDLTYNFAYSGHFRVMRYFLTNGNGEDGVFAGDCHETLYEFDFFQSPRILGAYGFPCNNGLADVIIEAEGTDPLVYDITEKDGEPFSVSNGQQNLFIGLEPGVYNFRVTDACGNFMNIQYDISSLPLFAIQGDGFCDNQDSSLFVKEYTFLEYEWWKEGDPGNILSTAYNLQFPDFDAADAGTYIVHVVATTPGSCIDITLEYTVELISSPNAGDDNALSLCNDATPLDLAAYLSSGHTAGGVWTTDSANVQINGSVLTTADLISGTYQFTYTVTSACNISDEAIVEVTFLPQPPMPAADIVSNPCVGGDLELIATSVPGASYEWTGPNGFSSTNPYVIIPNATAEASGIYQVVVSINGFPCPSLPASVEVTINEVPQFTIEGDTALCDGQTTLLSVVPGNFNSGEVSYEWYFEGELISTEAAIETNETGNYEIIVENGECNSSKEFAVTANGDAFDVELFIGCVNFDYTLQIVNIDEISGATVSWTGPSGFSSSEPDNVITGLPSGEYIATVTNAEGCSVTATVNPENTSCFIPRGVSPNGDGDNDSFDISNLEAQNLKIFNRYGMIVYEKDSYRDEWHGQSEKGDVPTGTYFYIVTLSAGGQITGWVYLQREE